MSLKKSQKNTIDNDLLEAEFFEDVLLIGIVSAFEYYKLVSFIIERLNIPFERYIEMDNVVSDICYPTFKYVNEDKNIEHFIFCNKRKTNVLMQDAKNIDFIYMLKGSLSNQNEIQHFHSYLKKVEGIDFSFFIENTKLKSRQYLIY